MCCEQVGLLFISSMSFRLFLSHVELGFVGDMSGVNNHDRLHQEAQEEAGDLTVQPL